MASNTRRAWAQIHEKDLPSNSRVGEKSCRVTMGSTVGNCTHLLTSPGAVGNLPWSLYGPPKCWCKITRLPDYSPAKIFFVGGINRELQQGLQSWWVTCKSPHSKGRGKRSWEGYNKKRVHGFHWLSPCQGRRGVFLCPFGLCYHCRAWTLPLLASWLYLTEVCLLIFYTKRFSNMLKVAVSELEYTYVVFIP